MVVACCDGTEVFEFIKETLDGIALPVKPMAEGRGIETIRHSSDISPGPTFSKPFAKGVGIISPICQKDVSRQHRLEHSDYCA